MADEDKAAKDGRTPADPPAVAPSAQTFEQASAPKDPTPPHETPARKPPGVGSEWTASDLRGPLGRAEDEEPSLGSVDERPAPASGPPPAIDETPRPSIADKSDEPSKPTAPEIADHPMRPVVGEAKQDAVPPDTSRSYAPPPESKRPLLAVAAGIVIGAAIGAGSAAFVYRSVQGDVVSDEVARLAARVDKLEKQPAAATAGDADTKQVLADLQGRVAALSKISNDKTDSEKSGGAQPSSVDLTPLQSKIATLQSNVDTLKAQMGNAKSLDAKLSGLESAVAGMKTQASSAQAGVVAMQGQQKQLAGKVMVPALAVASDSLVQQIGLGQPYAAQVDALASLGADPVKIAVLRQNAATGVPSAKVLAAKFEPLAEPIVSARPAAPNAGFVDRLKTGMLGLVSVRRADDVSGNDPASRVARIKADLAHDDVAGALAAWDGLPQDAKAKSEAWHALAKTHADAMSAARAVQRDAIAALGAKKS